MNGKKVDKHNNLTQYHKITKPSRKHFLECFVIYYLIIIWFLFFEPSLASLPSLHINGNCNLLLPAFLRRKRHHMTLPVRKSVCLKLLMSPTISHRPCITWVLLPSKLVKASMEKETVILSSNNILLCLHFKMI